MSFLRVARASLPGLVAWTVSAAAASPELDRAAVEFFEAKVRPVLVEHCYECHSASSSKLKGGLRLDHRDGLLQGGQSGPALIPGDPDRSLLIQAVRGTDPDFTMPPKGDPLPPQVVADLEAWVRMGAPDPRTEKAAGPAAPDAQAAHWAFQPITKPGVPEVSRGRRVTTPVDAFLLARLEEKGLGFSPRADRRTLIRRATYDLLGLPPTPEEVEAFLTDDAPDAYARLVDRLLDSPHYGERWGRYWLDVARYADTKGYLAGGVQRRFAYSYTYRDYVIRSLNEDLPFNRFILEQLAADHLDLGSDQRPLAALGYLTLGRRFLNNPHDIIDDRIDVVMRGMMGLTVTCARCHDHKFDPIPMADYYSLYGVFANSSEPDEKPLLGIEPPASSYQSYLAEKLRRGEKLDQFREEKIDQALAELRTKADAYLKAAHDARAEGEDVEKLARRRKLVPMVVERWVQALKVWEEESHPVMRPWFALASLPSSAWPEAARERIHHWSAEEAAQAPANPVVVHRLVQQPPATLDELAAAYRDLFQEAGRRWRELQAKAAGAEATSFPSALPDPAWEAIRQFFYAEGAPVNVPRDQAGPLIRGSRPRLRQLQAEVDEVDATHPGAPPRAMALVDNPSIRQPRIFRRGNPNNPGPEVAIQFLEFLSGEERKPFTRGSGRLELARAIVDPDNPLTRRVLVNRVWMHHFVKPLVETPSDFGLQSDPPSHPELLDYLAAVFLEEGWSLKKLHRLLMLSSAYQQSSFPREEAARVDPSNRLYWRMNRRRLDFEAMRDTLLFVSGALDPKQGGRSVDIIGDQPAPRRTVYGFIERQNLPGLFRTFDFASPDMTSPRRFHTTVPQQALFLMNSPFILDQARRLARRIDSAGLPGDVARVTRLFQLAYQRPPAPEELKASLAFLDEPAAAEASFDPVDAWSYGYGEVDEATGRASQFKPLPHFEEGAWRGGPQLPDPKLGWVMVSAEGGHPGAGLASIRRWTAPRDGLLRVEAALEHRASEGNGVRARVISSRLGLLGEWTVHHGSRPTPIPSVEVRAGETLDFVVDGMGSVSHDSYRWAPRLERLGPAVAAPSPWADATRDFAGPERARTEPLTRWEELVQAVMVSNELFFVD